jgi:hypothetical protein
MSNYDRMAISQKPDFYLSSNLSTDQSGTGLYGLTNGAANVGQPIISGNPSSWRVSSTESIALDANPIFFRDNTQLEFVLQKLQPITTFCIFGDTNNFNGIFLSPEGVHVRFVDSNLIQRSATVAFPYWPEKMHVILTFDSVYCTLRVNDQIAQVSYRETDPDSIPDISFKATSGNTYYIDGIGVYSDSFESKKDYISAPTFDYVDFISKTYFATSTLFDGYRGQAKIEVLNTQFTPDPIEVESYLFTTVFPLSTDEDFSSISIESNFADMQMKYKTNDGSWTSFTGNVSFTPTTNFFLLQIRVKAQDADRPFIIKIFPMFDDRIATNTPAELTPNGGPLYPDVHTMSIVNFPEGVELYEISYEGEWLEYIPSSIEIIFMPKDAGKTIVFESDDGSVSCGTGGSITGYTAYLNGALVTDLDDARTNQWNHLVLTMASPTDQNFYLNSDVLRANENIIEYAFLASYPSVLSLATVQQLYAIVSGYHKATVSEDPSDIAEGALDGVSPFKIYTYAWAIVGGGGV